MPEVIAGLTGGIGSGKSTVCGFFRAWGAHTIDLDAVAREAVAEKGAIEALVGQFGAGILDASGALDRRELARRAFADGVSRKMLTDVVWPRVGRRLKDEVARERAARSGRVVVVEAPLFLEWGDPEGLCEAVVVVTAPEAVRIARTVARLGISEAEVRARMGHQLPEEEKIKAADFVIVNDGGLRELEEKTRSVWDRLAVAG